MDVIDLRLRLDLGLRDDMGHVPAGGGAVVAPTLSRRRGSCKGLFLSNGFYEYVSKIGHALTDVRPCATNRLHLYLYVYLYLNLNLCLFCLSDEVRT